MKALLFRILMAAIAILMLTIQISVKEMDPPMATAFIISLGLFLIDVVTHGNSYDTPYHRTEYGSISYILFGRKKKE